MIKVEDNINTRLDSYLAEKLDLSRSKVQKLIKEDLVTVNGKNVNGSYQVKLNDEIEVNDDLNYEMNVEPENIEIDIVYEDEDLLVINKASGMVVHPAPGHYSGTLVNALLYKFNLTSGEKTRPGIVHRLDKDTSGVVLFAKNEKIKNLLQKDWNTITKRIYHAVVIGNTKEKETLKSYLKESKTLKTYSSESGDLAITNYEKIKSNNKYTLLKIEIKTGRKNQIRVQLSDINNPILGDSKYGYKTIKTKRMMLHATSLEIIEPLTKKTLIFNSEIPNIFFEYIK